MSVLSLTSVVSLLFSTQVIAQGVPPIPVAQQPVVWPTNAQELPLPFIAPITFSNGTINDEGFQLAEAFKCAVNQVSAVGVLPGLKLTPYVYDTKGDLAAATSQANTWLKNQYLYPFYTTAPTSEIASAVDAVLDTQGAGLLAYINDGRTFTSGSNVLRPYPDNSNQVAALWALIRTTGSFRIGVATLTVGDSISTAFFAAPNPGVVIACQYPSVSISSLQDFGTCMTKANVRNVVIFGSASDVIANFPTLVSVNGVQSGSLIYAPESWGNSTVLSRLIAAGVPPAVLYGTMTLSPTSGNYGLYAFCLSSLDSSSLVNAYGAGYRAYWESTFNCKVDSTLALCSATRLSTDSNNCQCLPSYKLNQQLAYNKGVNYVMDSVITYINALANIMYNCNNIASSIAPLVGNTLSFCSKGRYSGQDVINVASVLSFRGLTGQVVYKTGSRSAFTYDYYQYDSINQRMQRIGTYSTRLETSYANPNLPLVVPSASGQADVTLPKEASTVKPADDGTFIDIAWSNGAAIAIAFFASLGLLLVLVATAFVALKAQAPVIKRSSVLFNALVLIGLTLCFVDLYLWPGVQGRSMCIAKVWVGIVGLSFLIGPLLAKIFRVWKIYDNSKLRNRAIMPVHLLGMTGVVFGINLILLIVWTAVDPLYRVNSVTSGRSSESYEYCGGVSESTQNAFIIIFSIYNGLLLLLGSTLSFLTRNVNTSFNESKFVGFALYNLTIVFIIMVPVYYTSGTDPNSMFRKYVVRSAATIFATFICFLILFAPKFYHFFKGTEEKELPTTGKSVSTGKKGSPSKSGSSAPTGKTTTLVGPSSTGKSDATSAPGATFDDKSAVQTQPGVKSAINSGFETSAFEPSGDKGAGLVSIEEREERHE